MTEIILSPKGKIYPRFGYSLPFRQIAYVREDLPECVRKFVIAHELYHLRDKTKWWVWREIKANVAGASEHPIGFLVCFLMSLAPYRLRYYWKRVTGEDE